MAAPRAPRRPRALARSAAAAPRVYVAGPLFNRGERAVQARVARRLERAGYRTFLPQRDGLELADVVGGYLAQGLARAEAEARTAAAIYAFDIAQLFACDAAVCTVSGTEPDSGTAVEAATARAMGRAVVLFADAESRAFALSARINPMLLGNATARGRIVNARARLPRAVATALRLAAGQQLSLRRLSQPLREAVVRGRALIAARIPPTAAAAPTTQRADARA